MSLYELLRRPELADPVLVVALEGWIDAGLGGAGAVGSLLESLGAEPVASFDVDVLLDHRARRPMVKIVDGVNTALSWPEIHLRAGQDPEGRDVLVLAGPEPDHQWRAFARAVAELAGSFGVRLMVGLGAFPAPVPHTRPAQLAATSTSADLAAKVGFVPGPVNVPAGVQAAIERRFGEVGVPAISLWARVPHYLAGMPYPEASLRLLEGLAEVGGISVDTAKLQEAATAARQRIDELVGASEEHVAMVRQLEAQADAEADESGFNVGNLPSGDELAAEFERYLRGQGE